ncbi:hypothetical protein JEM65_13825 [Gelidibacter salicanalis]|uniref:Uncharacterized protein n=1 Tax=Gelidibacter salicanalis TaxID=291193 RepID=A0A934NJP5_9FLAO|nr:hypothetical protein [Gelidibacter salicanalis]
MDHHTLEYSENVSSIREISKRGAVQIINVLIGRKVLSNSNINFANINRAIQTELSS